MNKKTLTAALAAVLILAGCSNGNKPAETTTAAPETTTTAASETTAAAPETTTTTTEATTTEAETETDEAADEENIYKPNDDDVMLSLGGITIYGKDTYMNQYDMPQVDYGLVRLSTGTYYDSETNPDWFATDEFTYSGETVPLGELKTFSVGDKIGSLTVTDAATLFQPAYVYDDDDSKHKAWSIFSTHISLDGEIKLTGIARYFFDEQYTIGSGDIHIIPDASYAGMPVPVCFDYLLWGDGPTNGYGFTSFDVRGDWENQSYGGGLCVYTDAPELRSGNLKDDYSDRAEMFELFDGGNADCTKKVEVTLTDIHVSFSDQFGPGHCSAKIKDIKAID